MAKKTTKKAAADKKHGENAHATKGHGQDGRATLGRRSAVVDTRVVFCGDNLEQLRRLRDVCKLREKMRNAFGGMNSTPSPR